MVRVWVRVRVGTRVRVGVGLVEEHTAGSTEI